MEHIDCSPVAVHEHTVFNKENRYRNFIQHLWTKLFNNSAIHPRHGISMM
jgi:hypothetical protein